MRRLRCWPCLRAIPTSSNLSPLPGACCDQIAPRETYLHYCLSSYFVLQYHHGLGRLRFFGWNVGAQRGHALNPQPTAGGGRFDGGSSEIAGFPGQGDQLQGQLSMGRLTMNAHASVNVRCGSKADRVSTVRHFR